jgi:hypothetical protein
VIRTLTPFQDSRLSTAAAAWLRSAGRVGVLAVARAIAAARRLISTRH